MRGGFFKLSDRGRKACALSRCIFEDRTWVMSRNLGTVIWEQFAGLSGFLCCDVLYQDRSSSATYHTDLIAQ